MKSHLPAFMCAAGIILGTGSALLAPQAARADIGLVVETPPPFVEEGSTYNGAVIVAPPGINDYVFINNGWYYWNPSLNIWVHARHDRDWHPDHDAHIYHRWSEHPSFRGHEERERHEERHDDHHDRH